MGARAGERAGVRVLIVEDHEFFRRGLRLLLARQGFDVVGEAGRGEEALELVAATRPDVVVMDLHLPGMSGAETAARLNATAAPPAVLMLTVSANATDLYRALSAGAAGYVLKGSSSEAVARAVSTVAAGGVEVSDSLTPALVQRVRDLGPGAHHSGEGGGTPLTGRELEVLRLLARGVGNGTIASGLGISENTVKSHVASILGKLEVGNRIQAATLAVRRGLI